MQEEHIEEQNDNGFQKLLDSVKANNFSPADVERVIKAYELASEAHSGQKRRSGEPYIIHPVAVAQILADMCMDADSICAALLHDVVEDTEYTEAQIRAKFGETIEQLVDGVTKLGQISVNASREEQQNENVRKMFLAMSKDIRVIIIKLADRVHNMRTLRFMPEEKRRYKARETLEIYAPIAHRLGIRAFKEELEDLAISFLDPVAYKEIANTLETQVESRQSFLENIKEQIGERVLKEVPNAHISGRIKSVHGIYRKTYMQGRTIDEIYDIYAVRIIVDSVFECYYTLGIIHDMYNPLPGRFKDYISTPKPNMYQSLHTTVIGKDGIPFEVQIRTWEMHQTAEYGIAAHWKYKEGITGVTAMDDKLGWVKEVLSYDNDLKDSTEFLDLIRKDISNTNEVYVFTPNGDVKILQAGANALDFAYTIHSQVGNKCVGIKVNNKIVPLETVLNTGDTVEVMTNPNAKGPSRDWLKIVKTPSAKAKIRQFFKRELKDEYIRTGKSMIERDAKHRGIAVSELLTSEGIQAVCDRYMFSNVDEMYAAVGYGSISLQQVMLKLIATNKGITVTNLQQPTSPRTKQSGNKQSAVIVKGVEDLLVRFSRCCSPVPGDEIVGYISRGRGVCVHRADCPAIKNLEQERLVRAEWANMDKNATFPVSIEIISEDRGDIFAEITKTVANENLPMLAINARKDKKGNAIANITVEISNHEQANQLMNKVRTIPAVINVYRTKG